MIRRSTLLLLLFIGLHSISHAQGRDSVTIYIQPYTDTSCVGAQLTFSAVQSSDTFVTTPVVFHWYVDNMLQSVTIDTFQSTALAEGDSVSCTIVFVNSLGALDSSKSNSITIHHAASIPPNVLISVTAGNNPDCSGHPVTFTAYPINGGTNPQYQWLINGDTLVGEDSISITRYFSDTDTVRCLMVSNSSCAPFDSVVSSPVPIIHSHLTQSVTITTDFNPTCQGRADTFFANAINYGSSVAYQWYLDSIAVPGAIGPMYIVDTLKNNDSIYVMLTSTDSCVLNPVANSDTIHMHVLHTYGTYASIGITAGDNPGCADSPVTFTAMYDTFGTAPVIEWYVNSVGPLAVGSSTYTAVFTNLDTIYFEVRATDGGCYTHDTVITSPEIMVRDPHPVTPIISLIGDQLVANSSGTYTWYGPGGLIAGAVSDTYHPTVLGYYYAIKDSSNCNSDTSNIIYISLLGISNVTAGSISVYPNPTTGLVNIDLAEKNEDMIAQVHDVIGQVVMEQKLTAQHTQLNLSSFAQGNYYVELKDATGAKGVYKVVLQHN